MSATCEKLDDAILGCQLPVLPGLPVQHMKEQALLPGLHMGIMGLPGVSGQHMEALADLAT